MRNIFPKGEVTRLCITLKAEAAELALRAAHPNSHVALSTLKRPIPCTDRREPADWRSQLAARENSAPVTF